jgi:hypothetical protein
VPAPDPRQITLAILKRDRRRVTLFAALTVALWLMAVVGVALMWAAYVYLILPREEYLKRNFAADPPKVSQAVLNRSQLEYIQAIGWGVMGLAAFVVVLGLATLSTMVLVFASRRATLRQVNASLVEIAEQLRRLRPATGPPGG